ncbi:SHOCT domain-containing protein [Haloarcula nitratireducens]|uniref:SHOCT domain-containing protein n=1 Tax=Haloarcula nitratireducens TaxID=2487749 RepID=UPI002E2885D3|nr:SHOCT domain-containing protein [Halomicroarcula nitratireducens]
MGTLRQRNGPLEASLAGAVTPDSALSHLRVARRGGVGTRERPLSILRERYARGDLSEDEFERRRTLERVE